MAQNPKMIERRIFIFVKNILLTSGNVECKFYNPAEEFLSNAWKKSINVCTAENYNFFKTKTISPLCFCPHVEDFFTTPTKMFRQIGNDLHQCPVLIILKILQTKVLKISICTPKIFFRQPHRETRELHREGRKIFLRCPKKKENNIFLFRNNFYLEASFGHVDCRYDQPPKVSRLTD